MVIFPVRVISGDNLIPSHIISLFFDTIVIETCVIPLICRMLGSSPYASLSLPRWFLL